jgi:tetratricopeptide (TPR) repeat protein
MSDPVDSRADARTACVACKQPVHAEATVCPHCRSSQSPARWRTFGTVLKWIAGGTTVISLVVGANSIKALYHGWRDRRETVQELVAAAEMLDDAGDYARAWELLGEALEVDPASRVARGAQYDVAVHWIEDIRAIGPETFTSITDELIPVLYRGVAAASRDELAADRLAHLGWAYALRERDLAIGGPVVVHYERAIERDPDNVYAHTFWAQWILHGAPEGLEEAREHLHTALRAGRDRPFVRKWQLISYLFPLEAVRGRLSEAHGEILRDLVRTLDEMRRKGEPRPPAGLVARALACYGVQAENVHVLDDALDPEEHLATVRWLLADEPEEPSHPDRLVVAALLERTGNREEALAEYRRLYAEATSTRTEIVVDAGIERLTGEPTERALERRARKYISDPMPAAVDPWTFHAETLSRFDPRYSSENLDQALEWFHGGVSTGALEGRAGEVLELLDASRRRVKDAFEEHEARRRSQGFTGGYSIGTAMVARENLRSVWEAQGLVALTTGRLDGAIALFEDLLRRLVPEEDVGLEEADLAPHRARTHYNLACAFSRRSQAEEGPHRAATVSTALEHLQQAVALGFDDWEWLQADSDLEGVRDEPGYAELVRGR